MPNPRVVASFLTDRQDFQLMQAADARDTAQRLGVDLEVLFAENNSIVQVQQLFKHIHAPEDRRPAAIIAETVAGDGLERVARNAARAGIGWVLLNGNVGYLDALRVEFPALPISVFTADQTEIGQIQGRQFRALLPKGGSLIYIQGPPDTHAAIGRLQGMQDALAGAAIETRVLQGDWTEAGGERAMTAWLRLRTSESFQPDVVGAQNDAMAVGARRSVAIHRPEWSHLLFTGCDGTPDGGRKLVDDEELAATVVVPSLAGPALERIARLVRGGEPLGVRNVLPAQSYPPEKALKG